MTDARTAQEHALALVDVPFTGPTPSGLVRWGVDLVDV